MLSSKDIDQLVGKFKGIFATKKDLDAFATKKDLDAFATKKDLDSFATKKDIDAQADRFMQVFVTKEDHEELKDRMDTFEDTQQKILSAVESFASTKDRKTFEDAARDAQLSRHDGWIKQLAKGTKIKLSS